MAEQNNQVARELKQLDAKELDPASLNVRDLRGRSANEELHMPSIKQSAPLCVYGAIQNSKLIGICLPPSINQSTAASVSSISPQPSSDLDTDQGDIIDETIKQVAQSVNQTLLKTSTDNPVSSLTQNGPRNNVTNKQTICDSNPSDIHSQTNTQPIHTHQPVSPKNNITHQNTSFKQAKQIITNIDALLHLPTLQNNILQKLNLHGLCKYSSTQQAYMYKNANKIVNCSHILVFLKHQHIRQSHQTYINGIGLILIKELTTTK